VADLPKLQRILCPNCIGCVGGECERCNGSGYVLKDPYALTSGEQGIDEDELEQESEVADG